jgi:hypothetical protein
MLLACAKAVLGNWVAAGLMREVIVALCCSQGTE